MVLNSATVVKTLGQMDLIPTSFNVINRIILLNAPEKLAHTLNKVTKIAEVTTKITS